MSSRSTVIDPYAKTVTITAGGQSRTYSFGAAISTASIADQLSPEMISLIVKALTCSLQKTA